MTDPVNKAAATASNLVEGQGVNAGEQDQAASAHDDVRRGGDPQNAPDPREGFAGYPSQKSDEELTGGSISNDPQAEQKDGTSGQDEGLMN
ncbi:hypothetical protein [Kineosporia sp. NBRC 101731]|uniref:hypothetical protein n=1 Tax=Kineosporia sp. NBRC 101731 TaxID=3032199 RepID=UPI0024A58003|nr:hypothetical protein [Kineosporia sp. NBRC 101731]GLY29931.1 hypothetical protein Kisp02_32960 [Kineosporia sp. NBRC 101731]